MIFGIHENITPSFLVNKSTGIIEEEAVKIKKESYKKQKTKNNVEVIATAIAEIGQTYVLRLFLLFKGVKSLY